jgi:hypothetical protein
MPLKFWDEAFLTAVFIINRLPSKVIANDTPFSRLLGQDPEYSSLRTFGCACWPNLRPYNTRKLQFRSKHCVFLGYSNYHKGFKCLDPLEGRVYISRDVTFDENLFPFASMHPNAGARLKAEIQLLPDILLNSSTNHGDAALLDRTVSSPVPANASVPAEGTSDFSGFNLEPDAAISCSNTVPYRVCRTEGGSTLSHSDAPGGDTGGNGESPPGSKPLSSPHTQRRQNLTSAV